MKKILLLSIITLFFSSGIIAQDFSKNNLLSIDDNFIITLNQENNLSVEKSYLLDISSLNFQSQEELTLFCENASGEFHIFEGDFKDKKINIIFNTKKLHKRGIKTRGINKYFLSISNRLKSQYNNINSK